MRFFKNGDEVRAFEDDVVVEDFIDLSVWIELFGDDVRRITHPEEFYTEEEKLAIFRARLRPLGPVEFEIMLGENGYYEAVYSAISVDWKLKSYYTRSTVFKRLDDLLDQLRVALNITHEALDSMWLSQGEVPPSSK